MKDDLFPKEIIEFTSEYYIWKNTVKSQLIYSSIVLFLVLMLFILPYLKVDISVLSRGIIRPVIEKENITSLVSGRIESLRVTDNQAINKGDIVAIIESSTVSNRLSLNKKEQIRLLTQISDLTKIVRLDSSSFFLKKFPFKFKSSIYQDSFIHFQESLLNKNQQIMNAQRLLNQNKYLYQKQDISKSKYENSVYHLSLSMSKLNVMFEDQMSRWQLKLDQDQQKLNELLSTQNELQSKLKHYTIKAPVTGTIQNLDGLSDGSYIYANQKLAVISPDTELIAECYVSPQNIGLLRKGMNTRFQIDTYNSNEWGTLDGHIEEISSDVSVINNQAVFKVKCKLNHTYLVLDNGSRGYLKKGMTLESRFMVTRISLFQFLYNHIDDWLNPTKNFKNNGGKKNI